MSYYLLTSSNDQWLIRPQSIDGYDFMQLNNPFGSWMASRGTFSSIAAYRGMTLLQIPDTLVLLRVKGALA